MPQVATYIERCDTAEDMEAWQQRKMEKVLSRLTADVVIMWLCSSHVPADDGAHDIGPAGENIAAAFARQ